MSTKKIQIVGSLGNRVYTQNEEPVDAADGSLWVDLDEDGTVIQYATTEYVDEAVKNVEVDLTGYATTDYVDATVGDIQKTLSLMVGGI